MRYVSIHASVKDATDLVLSNFGFIEGYVSIHASVKDATCYAHMQATGFVNVSIHASVKDATPCL